MSRELDFFRTHSPITDPGANAALFNMLPDNLPGIAHAVQGLVYHYVADEQSYHWPVPKERLPEIDTRMVENMLARITTMDARPLTETRAPQKRLIGCCRDFTALFVAAVRHKGIAARSRHGFASYFVPGSFIDHVIAEVWEEDRQRWRMVDPELPPEGFPNVDVMD
ncbi:MAG: transglutaminase domain-containing protein, partial [Roseiflexaceae bacterium]